MLKNRFIGLRSKMLLALALGIVLIFSIILFAARTVLLDGYTKLEKDKTLIQLTSATSLLQEQSDQLDASVRDSAHWDDMYQYMLKPNLAFTESNFANSIFTTTKVNAIFIVNQDGKARFQKGIDYATNEPWPIPPLLMQATTKGGALIDPLKHSQSGLFWTPEGILIVAAVDILNSAEKGARRDTLVMVRPLDETLIEHINKILGIKLSIQAKNSVELNKISPSLSNGETAVIPLNNTQVAGFATIKPIGGNANLLLSAVVDRKIYEQGKSNLKFLYWASLLVALLLAAFSWLLDKLVLSRLARLNSNVARIAESAVISGRVQDFSGNDEMSGLAHGINGMLERLDETQHALVFEKERAQVTFTSIADAVVTSNIEGNVLYMNTAAEHLIGVNAKHVVGLPLTSLFKLLAEDKITPIDSDWQTQNNSEIEEVLFERADGQTFVVTKSTSPLYDFNGILFGTVTVLHDITTLRALSNQLSYQARYDALTGLVNRYEFDRKAQAAIEDTQTTSRTHCLAFIDLDKFKIVNDTCGHSAGDLLLKQLANLLKTKVRSADTLARLGGDEFAVLLSGCNLQKGQEIINELLVVVHDFRFNFQDKVFRVGASIGLTEIPDNQALNLSELLATADAACYAAKRDGGNCVHVQRVGDANFKEQNQQLEMVTRINNSLENNQFVLFVQSLQGTKTDAEQHCELLIRMRGDKGELYLPSAFLLIAERYHLMPQIDRWVVNEALTIIAAKGAKFKTVCAINLSGQSISQDGFLEYVLNKIKEYGVNTQRICFEITETAVITDLEKAQHFMKTLRGIGCRFSLDDFGSGLSSFAYLKNFEVDFLKIDGMFIKSIVDNKIDRAMVESINNVGHVMGLHTIAEFAESKDIINTLKDIGIDYTQGFAVSMPKLFT